MIILPAALFGFLLGWLRARAAGGNTKDRVQWAFAHMLAFLLLGLFVTIFIARMG
ncbi:MAG: hypothetical protein Q4G26_13195 [Paracoccus sp. (in: a-proteobacteria)]|nr:hypothetical protein [Paracoccus sp. (in: a-proteobacteria)]